MDEDLNLDNIEVQAEEKLKVKNRFEKLSEKVILTSKEKEEAEVKAKAETERADALAKERDFYKDFSANVSKYPNAAEFQDKILEKVKGGYSTEDAMVSVLAKEGKLTMESSKSNLQAEGGSAPNITQGEKTYADMTAEEKRNLLIEADKDGSLITALRGR